MFLLRRTPRPGRFPTPRRTRLFAEPLEGREAPAGFEPGLGTIGGEVLYTPAVDIGPPGPAPQNAPPQIVGFTAEDCGGGQFKFSGRVADESPGGLTVTFSGSVGSVRGKTVVTAADGTFTYIVRLKTDGSDTGTVSAQTKDNFGVLSNVPSVDVAPTPP